MIVRVDEMDALIRRLKDQIEARKSELDTFQSRFSIQFREMKQD